MGHPVCCLLQVDGLGRHVPENWGYCSCSRPTIGSVPRGSDCFAAASSSLRGEVINLSPNSDDRNINVRGGGDAVIFPTSRPLEATSRLIEATSRPFTISLPTSATRGVTITLFMGSKFGIGIAKG